MFMCDVITYMCITHLFSSVHLNQQFFIVIRAMQDMKRCFGLVTLEFFRFFLFMVNDASYILYADYAHTCV